MSEEKYPILPIHIEGDPILREKCIDISSTYLGLKGFIERMHKTLDATGTGVGLAAPQVGRPVNIFIMGGNNPNVKIPRITFINPEIVQSKGSRKKDFEGCLSVPGVHARVERWQKIKIKYLDENLKEKIRTFKGFEARIIQHEFDHILGISFHERISRDEYIKIENKLEKLRNGDIPKVDYLIKQYGKERDSSE